MHSGSTVILEEEDPQHGVAGAEPSGYVDVPGLGREVEEEIISWHVTYVRRGICVCMRACVRACVHVSIFHVHFITMVMNFPCLFPNINIIMCTIILISFPHYHRGTYVMLKFHVLRYGNIMTFSLTNI